VFFLDVVPEDDNVRSIKMARRTQSTTTSRAARSRRRGQLGFQFRTWGGKRQGAGRRPKIAGRPGVPHRPRPEWARRLPVHVTLRMAPEVYNLRSRRSFRAIELALRLGADRFDVRITSFSVQGNHMHLLVEAPSRLALARAVKGFSVRIARGLNKMMQRKGRVLGDRYHAHILRTPTEVKRAIVYVRDNARKHAAERGEAYSPRYVDPYSSAAVPAAVRPPQTWLLREGWKRGAP
jgi:REP-associated tyrosine transposase